MYEIKKTVGERRQNKHIVITPIRNMMERAGYLEPADLVGSYRYTWERIQDYFMADLQAGIRRERNGLPMHYFAEQCGRDYAIHVGQPLTVPTYWIQRLAEKGVVEYSFHDAVVVALGEDFTIDVPSDRLLAHMAHKLLTPLMTILDIPERRVQYVDEIVNWDKLRELVRSDEIPYDRMVPSTFFDPTMLMFMIKNFKKPGNH